MKVKLNTSQFFDKNQLILKRYEFNLLKVYSCDQKLIINNLHMCQYITVFSCAFCDFTQQFVPILRTELWRPTAANSISVLSQTWPVATTNCGGRHCSLQQQVKSQITHLSSAYFRRDFLKNYLSQLDKLGCVGMLLILAFQCTQVYLAVLNSI